MRSEMRARKTALLVAIGGVGLVVLASLAGFWLLRGGSEPRTIESAQELIAEHNALSDPLGRNPVSRVDWHSAAERQVAQSMDAVDRPAIRVVSRQTWQDLDEVQIWTVNRRDFLSPRGTGGEQVILEGTSPLPLFPIAAGGSYWVSADGYVGRRFSVEAGRTLGLTIALEPGATIHAIVSGLGNHSNMGLLIERSSHQSRSHVLALRLYAKESSSEVIEQEISPLHSADNAFQGVPLGDYVIRIELGESGHSVSLTESDLSVESLTDFVVRLVLPSVPDHADKAVLRGTLRLERFDESIDGELWDAGYLRLVPIREGPVRSAGATPTRIRLLRNLVLLNESDEEFLWDFGSVEAGSYQIEVHPTGYFHEFEVEMDTETFQEIELPPLAYTTVAFEDQATGERVHVRKPTCSLIQLPDGSDSGATCFGLGPDTTGESVVVSLPGTILVGCADQSYGSLDIMAVVNAGWNAVSVPVIIPIEVDVELYLGPDPYRAPTQWWMGVTVDSVDNSGELYSRSWEQGVGASHVIMRVTKPGTYRMTFPSLPGMELRETVEVIVGRQEGANVRLDLVARGDIEGDDDH